LIIKFTLNYFIFYKLATVVTSYQPARRGNSLQTTIRSVDFFHLCVGVVVNGCIIKRGEIVVTGTFFLED